MEHLLAMVVAVFSGDVRADVGGKSYAFGAGQGGIFSFESVSLNALQDDDDNNDKGKNEQGKQNEKGKNEKGKNEKDE